MPHPVGVLFGAQHYSPSQQASFPTGGSAPNGTEVGKSTHCPTRLPVWAMCPSANNFLKTKAAKTRQSSSPVTCLHFKKTKCSDQSLVGINTNLCRDKTWEHKRACLSHLSPWQARTDTQHARLLKPTLWQLMSRAPALWAESLKCISR